MRNTENLVTAGEITSRLTAQHGTRAEAIITQVNEWLSRGHGIAVYTHDSSDYPGAGEWFVTDYGTEYSTIPEADPPDNMPREAARGGIQYWRYTLVGTFRGPGRLPADPG